MHLRAIIFDLGGTLIDWPDWNEDIDRRWSLSYDYLIAKSPANDWPARTAYIQAMRQAEQNHWQRVTEQQTSSTPTDLLKEGFHLLKRPVSASELVVALDGYAQAVNGWATIFPDTVPTLRELRKQGYCLAVLSNTWWAAEWHNADLALHGLTPLLDAALYTSDLPHSKPHPSTFLTVAARLHVAPAECVMVGDRLVDDISGAQGVGMRAIWKKTSHPWPEPASITPTATITELAALLPLLEQWQSSTR